MTESGLYVPIPAPAPLPPQVSLLSCARTPGNEANDTTDDSVLDLSMLPIDLRAELELDATEKWIRGIGYLPRSGYGAIARAPGDTTTVDDPFTPPNEPSVLCQPWTAFTKFTLTSLDWEAEDFLDRANEQLDAAVPAAIESEFWDGTLAQANGWPNNYLTNITNPAQNLTPGATTISNGTAVSVVQGLGILQTALRKGIGGQGMIHVTPEAVPNLLNTRRVGKFLLDMFDNIIIPGVGYSGNGPGGAAPSAGETWMYGTDLVSCRVQKKSHVYPGSFAEALDRSQGGYPNTITFRAFKFVAAYFDGFRQYAVKVTLPT